MCWPILGAILGVMLAHLGSMLAPCSAAMLPQLGAMSDHVVLCFLTLLISIPFFLLFPLASFIFYFWFTFCWKCHVLPFRTFFRLFCLLSAESATFFVTFSNMFDVFCFFRVFTLQTLPVMRVMHPHLPSITRIAWWKACFVFLVWFSTTKWSAFTCYGGEDEQYVAHHARDIVLGWGGGGVGVWGNNWYYVIWLVSHSSRTYHKRSQK